MGWDTEFRSPIEIVEDGSMLRTLKDAAERLLPADEDAELTPAQRLVRRNLRLAATRTRPKDLSDATISVLRAIRASGHVAIMNTDHIRQKREPVAERPKLPTPKLREGRPRAHDPSKVPDIHDRLREQMVRARLLKVSR